MNTRTTKNNRQGFTLLEVLIALAILVVGIMAIMQMFPGSLLQARMAAERTVTAELANSVLGQIRASSAEALYHGRLPDGLLSVYNTYGLYDGYTTSIQRLTGAHEVFLQRVTFTVRFFDGRHESFVTFVSQQ